MTASSLHRWQALAQQTLRVRASLWPGSATDRATYRQRAAERRTVKAVVRLWAQLEECEVACWLLEVEAARSAPDCSVASAAVAVLHCALVEAAAECKSADRGLARVEAGPRLLQGLAGKKELLAILVATVDRLFLWL